MPARAIIPTRAALALVTTVAAVALLVTFDASSRVDGAVAGGTGGGNGSAVAPAASTSSAGSRTITGQAVSTRYGTVQVAITVQAGRITDVTAVQLPTDAHSAQISQSAAAILRQEVLSAQSAQVDAVSGATYTSQGYLQSLQGALDQAGI